MNPTILSPTLKSILHRIEAEHAEEPVWIVGPETGKMLYWLVRVTQPKTILEIGTSVGYSALWFASALQDNEDGLLYTIESHKERFGRAQANIAESGLSERVKQLKGHAPEIFSTPEDFGHSFDDLPDEVDIAFFDATKKQHNEFLSAVLPLLKTGSLLIVDNVKSHQEELQDFLDTTYGHEELQVVEIPVGQGLLIARVL